MPTDTLTPPPPARAKPFRRVDRPPTARRLPQNKPSQPSGDFLTELHRMGREHRLDAYREGRFDRRQRSIWAARFPEEVPLLNGEIEWVARSLADLD